MKVSYVIAEVLILLNCIWFPIKTLGYDSKTTHPRINQFAAAQLEMGPIMKKRLGLENGLNELLLRKTALEWLKEGGEREDDFPLPRNHFHDPLVGDWENASLGWGPSIFEGVSSLVWAQERFSNIYSWSKARNAYYHVFTCPSNDIPQALNPEYYMCRTLRSLGHKLESENQHGQ